jgi:thymidylate kinase
MANLIILEGLSRTGKTTIAENLQRELNYRKISIKNKIPETIENYHEFYHGIHIMANEMFKAFPEETFILDRSFLSEIVYSQFFLRPSLIYKDQIIEDLLFDNTFTLVFLDSNYQNYIERNPKDRIVFSEEDFIKQKDLFQWHFYNYRDKNASATWRNQFLHIDTATTSLADTIIQIKQKINEK